MRNIVRSVKKASVWTILFSSVVLVMVFVPSMAQADSQECAVVLLNPGQCICHNYLNKDDEICPSESGVVNGHDCHLADYCCYPPPVPMPDYCNLGNLDCSLINEGGVQDTFGKCNGCGDGLIESADGCCDPRIDPEGCTDPSLFCEECDDGSNVNGTHNCDEHCQLENCNNGVIEEFEQCDLDNPGICDAETEACNLHCQCCPDFDGDGDCDLCEVDEDCSFDEANLCIESVMCIDGECVLQPVSCNDGNFCTDDSCDAELGCESIPNSNTIPCYTGTEGTENIGECKDGEYICVDGILGDVCMGEITPIDEICDNGLDDDCDGDIDEAESCLSGVNPEGEGGDIMSGSLPAIGGCSLIR